MHINTQDHLSSRFGPNWSLLIFCALICFMSGCDQQRYKPAQWRPAARNSRAASDSGADNAVSANENWGTLPSRGATWGTLPAQGGTGWGTLPGRGGWGTLPNRGGSTLPSRVWSTLPGRSGIGTLPFRGGSTLPNRGGFLPEQRWQKFPARPMGTLPNRGGARRGSTLPQRRKIYEAINTSVPEQAWKNLPDRSALRAGQLEDGGSNPLRK